MFKRYIQKNSVEIVQLSHLNLNVHCQPSLLTTSLSTDAELGAPYFRYDSAQCFCHQFQNSMSFASTMPYNPSDKEDGDLAKAGPITMFLPKCSLDHIYQACNPHQDISRNPVEKSPSRSTQQHSSPPFSTQQELPTTTTSNISHAPTMCSYHQQKQYCYCPVAPSQLTSQGDKSRRGLPCRRDITYYYTMTYCNFNWYLGIFYDT